MSTTNPDHRDSPTGIRPGHVVHAGLLDTITYELIPMKKTADKIADLPAGSTVSVTASPVQGPESTLDLARLVAAAGHTVIPHLSARIMPSRQRLDQLMAEYAAIGVDQFFVIAGDPETPAGPWKDSLDFLVALVDAAPETRRIGFGSYPDGHAFISDDDLTDALHRKQSILAEAKIDGYTTTQMCFSADKTVEWLGRERARGFALPVKLGVPGSVDRTKLVTMGMRLGVGASLRYLKKNRGVLGSLLGPRYDPNELIADLLPHADRLAITGVHCFTFNQVASTVTWHDTARAAL